jgi:hypothetical protein
MNEGTRSNTLIKPIIAAIALSLLAVSSASALPAAGPKVNSKAIVSPLAVTQVQHKVRHKSRRSHGFSRPAPRFVPGHRYHSAPHGWHRFSARPHNWRTRGCILVGPIWFCP